MSKDTYPWISHERPAQLEIDPEYEIDPTTQATRTPGIDARCENGLTADTCRWPYCDCYAPDRY